MSNDVSLDINQKSNPVQTVAPPFIADCPWRTPKKKHLSNSISISRSC